MARQFLIAALFVLLGIVAFRITDFRGRWFLPLLGGFPVLLVAATWARLDGRRARALKALAVTTAVVVAVLLPCRIIFAGRMNRFEPLHKPYSKLAPQIAPILGSNTVILAETRVIAGNLRLAGLAAPVVSLDTWEVMPHANTNLLFVWDATRQPEPAEKVASALERLGIRVAPEPRMFEAVCHHHRSRLARLACAPATADTR
jgi:hypothetical protein